MAVGGTSQDGGRVVRWRSDTVVIYVVCLVRGLCLVRKSHTTRASDADRLTFQLQAARITVSRTHKPAGWSLKRRRGTWWVATSLDTLHSGTQGLIEQCTGTESSDRDTEISCG